MGFLDVLGKQLESQFGIGEVQDHSINAKIDGKDVLYGRLGNYASQFDHTAERSYVDQGFIRPNAYQMDLNTLDVLMQEPNATVLIKKRMFSSLAENYNLSTMDKDEKLFYRASQILFNNKCKQISALEKLSKIESITRTASITEQFLPAIFNLTESVADATFSLGGEQSDTGIYKFIATIDKIRKNYAFNKTAKTTTWLQDSTTYLKNRRWYWSNGNYYFFKL